MPNAAEAWRVNVARAAENDIEEIQRWTRRRFGRMQAEIYSRTIADAIAALVAGPGATGIRVRPDIRAGLYTLRLSHFRPRARNLVLFRIKDADRHVIDVIRVLHDAMDLMRHVPPEGDTRNGAHG